MATCRYLATTDSNETPLNLISHTAVGFANSTADSPSADALMTHSSLKADAEGPKSLVVVDDDGDGDDAMLHFSRPSVCAINPPPLPPSPLPPPCDFNQDGEKAKR